MYTKSSLMFLYAETPLHVGSGTSLSAVDLPIQRERYTNFPVIPGSGIKGAIREWFEWQEKDASGNWKNAGMDKIATAFGPDLDDSPDADLHAGALTFTDARILLFPVRSVKGVFAYVTCPLVLSRLQRDLRELQLAFDWQVPQVGRDAVRGVSECDLMLEVGEQGQTSSQILLEDYSYTYSPNDNVDKIANWLSTRALAGAREAENNTYWQKKIKSSLLVMQDDDFRDFTEHSTEVQARVKLNEKKTTSGTGNLFYEENLPPETLFYCITLASIPHAETPPDSLNTADKILTYAKKLNDKRLQVGGDESIGKGYMHVRLM